MQAVDAEIIVAGHICLDIIPTFERRSKGIETLLVPGQLRRVGPAVIATGGAVSNTGIALHRLGVATRLMGKVGDDLFGQAILEVLQARDPALADGMIVVKGEHSSYSLVLSMPGVDRIFLHCPGANDTFGADDVAFGQLGNARLFHFGYPPLMRRMYIDGGQEVYALLSHVKERGLTTSLDMAQPDAQSEAGRVDWERWLQRVLPVVDMFLPSLDEILFMVDRQHYGEGRQGDAALLAEVAEKLLQWGTAVVALKLGDGGLYVRTTQNETRLASLGKAVTQDLSLWMGRELFVPCFQAEVVGTTGAGDCTIAGFLAGVLRGLTLEEVMVAAVAVGACSVERADATSGVPAWSVAQQRIDGGWQSGPVMLSLHEWQRGIHNVWSGPHDAGRT